MSQKNGIKNFIAPIAALLVIAVVSAFVLGEVHEITLDPIQEAKDARELKAISEVVEDFDNDPFEERKVIVTKNRRHKLDMYPARKDGQLHSVAIKSYTNTGFAGRIELMVGFNADGSVNNFKVLSSHETPGLGAKIDEPKFKKQFKGMHPQRHAFKVRQDGGKIDAVTGATISSRAIIRAITRAYDAFSNFNSGYAHE